MDIILLIVGIIVLLQGANMFVSGASGLAKHFRIPTFIIGLTIVAFGTSAPEAAVSISASLRGFGDLALGNIVGSSLMNILVILGLSAIFMPVIIKESVIKRELPFALLATLLLIAFYYLGHQVLGRLEGAIFLTIFVIFMWVLLKGSRNTAAVNDPNEIIKNPWLSTLFLIIGAVAIAFGGDLITNKASNIAVALGMSEMLIGLTIVAIGTSLPELMTTLVAAFKKETDIALGNIIGSNIFNILFVLGITSVISPMHLSRGALMDMVLLFVITLITFVFAFTDREITKKEGIVMVSIYCVYLIFIIIRN